MKAVIMAGGEGSRLRPLTCDRPKPMVPVMDRPIMQHIVELLYKHNFYDIGATLMYLPEDIKDFFGDGSDFGVKMRYFVEESPLGTAGSVKNAQDFLDEPFLVISGDALTDFDLTKIKNYHREKKAAVTIVLTRVPNPLEYGVVICDNQGYIKQFLEKPSWGEVFSDTVNTGIYMIEPEILDLIPQDACYDFSKDLFPLLLHKGYPVFGCVMPGYWCDIGNLSQYQQAHYDILSGRTNITLNGTELAEGVWMGKGAEIHPEARLEAPVFIGRDVKIGKDVFVGSFSVIGSNSILDEGVSIKKSIIWNNVYLGKKATLRGASVCNRVKIKSHASVFEGSVVGDDTVLDDYTSIKPGVKIWPHKMVEKGTILKESLIWADKIRKNLFGANGVSGTINVEMTPETAVRLGAAFGSCSKKQGQITVGADGYASSQMIKNAITVGLLSTGCHVLDLGKIVTPISRYGVKTLGVNGGIHVSSMELGERVCITFFDHKGTNISKSEERKIENAFFREDFRRVSGSQVPTLNIFPNIVDSYYENLIKSVDREILRSARLKVFLDFEQVNFGEQLPKMLQILGCEVLLSEKAQNGYGMKNDLKWHRSQVLDFKCDLGVVLSSDGEYLALIDSKGMVIQEDLFTALVSLIVLKTNTPCTVVVPVTASQVIEKLAHKYKGNVIRTKTARQFYMEKMLDEKTLNTTKGYKQFSLQFDAINALVNILEYLAKEKTSLSALIKSVPEFYISRRDIECPWDAKGTVMRRLIEEQDRQTELLDGIKVFHEKGWALILPDSEEPVCRIFSEGISMEAAEELTNMYVNKVNNFKKD